MVKRLVSQPVLPHCSHTDAPAVASASFSDRSALSASCSNQRNQHQQQPRTRLHYGFQTCFPSPRLRFVGYTRDLTAIRTVLCLLPMSHGLTRTHHCASLLPGPPLACVPEVFFPLQFSGLEAMHRRRSLLFNHGDTPRPGSSCDTTHTTRTTWHSLSSIGDSPMQERLPPTNHLVRD